jgi:1-phosphofructokinase
MIITLTLNPAVDQTMVVSEVTLGEVNRVREVYLDPAGKGINVSRMVHRLGWPTIAFGFLAGEIGLLAEKALDNEGVQYHFVHVPGQTRLNVALIDESTGVLTNYNGRGLRVDEESVARLDEVLTFWLQAGSVLVLAGSLPRGMPEDTYARYIELAKAAGSKTILDADGEPLRLGLEAEPTLIKPNRPEAQRLLGRSLPDLEAVTAAARELAATRSTIVIISMGGNGAVYATKDGAWLAVPPDIELNSSVGSGDALVAGLAVALAGDRPLVEGLREGTAAGAATAQTAGTTPGSKEEVARLLPQVQIKELP